MRYVKEALTLKFLNSVVELSYDSFKAKVKELWHKVLNHRLYYIQVHSSWAMYNWLRKEAIQSAARKTHYEFQGMRHEGIVDGGIGVKKVIGEFDPNTTKIIHEGKTLTLSFYEVTPSEDEIKRGKTTEKYAKVSSYHSLEVIEAYLQGLDNLNNSYEVTESTVYTFHKDSRKELGYFRYADILPPVLPKGVLYEIVSDATKFEKSQDKYRERGIPYHRGYYFYGPPGTGKSSITYFLGKSLKRNLYQITAASLTSSNIQEIISRIANNSIVVVEDIDCMYHGREALDRALPAFNDVLNAFDSIVAPKGLILIVTTNHLEHLDSALLRPGRLDRGWEFTYCDCFQINGLVKRFYPQVGDINVPSLEGKFTPAKIQELLIETNSYEEFFNALSNL